MASVMEKFKSLVYAVSLVATASVVVACSESFTDDRDGQSYNTIQIGDQLWMAENLNFAGVGGVAGDEKSNVVAAGSFCPEGDERNCKKYGRLYTWEAAQVACPAGWRLPTGNDFMKLIAAADPAGVQLESGNVQPATSNHQPEIFGGQSVVAANKAGGVLKSSSGWFKKGNGSDAVHFKALPAGYMIAAETESEKPSVGKFDGIGGYAHIWSSSTDEQEPAFAYYLYLDFSSMAVGFNSFSKLDARSVRCVKY